MKTSCMILSNRDLGDVRREITQIRELVETSAGKLAVLVRTKAPVRTGDLVSGIVPSPWEENSKYPGKIVRQVYMDFKMNDTFVKMSKSGKRYYYPASQEYSFRIANRTALTAKQASAYGIAPRHDRVPGKYFMRDSAIAYVPAFEAEVKTLVEKVVSK